MTDDETERRRREKQIIEAALAAWRCFLDLRLEDKFMALEMLEQRLEQELAGWELAQLEGRLHS
jgi:hypothetical protein